MNNKFKVFSRLLSSFLALSILATCLPNGSFASPSSNTSLQENLNVSPFIVKEDETQRTEFSKTFLRSDGMNVLISAAQSLHYIDKETNKWSDIDNTLVSDKDANGKDILVNKDNPFKISLPAEIGGNSYVTTEKDGYKLSFKMAGTSNSRTDKINKVDQITAEEKAGTVKNEIVVQKASDVDKKTAIELSEMKEKSDTAVYSEIETDTDISYDVQANSLKETITLKKAPAKEKQYIFDFFAEGLTAKKMEDNSIEFYDIKDEKSKPVFVMPAPFMYDNANSVSTDIKTTLESTATGFRITYLPSFEWLSAIDRKYPCFIDPTVTSSTDNANINDSYIYDDCGSSNFGSNPSLYVGEIGYHDGGRSYIKINTLPTLSQGSIITDAKLNMTQAIDDSMGTWRTDIYKVTSSWSEGGISYTYKPSHDARILDCVTQVDENTIKNVKFSITDLVNDWYNGTATNYGVMIKQNDVDSSSSTCGQFFSSEYGTAAYHPYLEIEFKDGNGNEGAASQRTFDVGRAGTVHINDFTGNLSVVRNDIGVDGNIMPVNISMIYNTISRNENITNCTGLNRYGAGWRTNYNQTIEYVPVSGTNPVAYYEYTTEDGHKIYFENNSEIYKIGYVLAIHLILKP